MCVKSACRHLGRAAVFALLVAPPAWAVALPAPPGAAADPMTLLASGRAHDALFAIAFDGGAGLAAGSAGQLVESADAGASWNPVAAVPTQEALLGVALAPGHAIAVGQHGKVLVRQAGGAWVAAQSGTSARLFAVGVNAAGRAVVGGAFGVVLKSENGGQEWSSIAPSWAEHTDGADPHVYAASVSDAGVITIAGEFGLILRSLDGGATWRRVHKGDASLFGLELRKDGRGSAVGQNGTVLTTADAGVTWKPATTNSTANLLSVACAGNGACFVTGMHEILASADAGLTWRQLRFAQGTLSWFSGIGMEENTQQAIAVGNSGQIVRVGKQ
jgi:photosystem II stability/assembly factor-like uncharacterized protein